MKPNFSCPMDGNSARRFLSKMQSGNEVSFKPISLDMLVDSPVITGEYYRSIDLTPPGEPIHHEIDMAADSETR